MVQAAAVFPLGGPQYEPGGAGWAPSAVLYHAAGREIQYPREPVIYQVADSGQLLDPRHQGQTAQDRADRWTGETFKLFCLMYTTYY